MFIYCKLLEMFNGKQKNETNCIVIKNCIKEVLGNVK